MSEYLVDSMFFCSGVDQRLGSARARRSAPPRAGGRCPPHPLLSVVRESEALTLWRYPRLTSIGEAVTLEESKTGRSMRPLGSAALAVLREIDREEGSDFVFPGQAPGSHLVEIRKVWNRVRTDACLTDVRLHDLRHSVASIAASGGASLPLIGALLGHRDVKSTQRYAHLTDDARKLVADKTAREISDALAGRVTSVVPLRMPR